VDSRSGRHRHRLCRFKRKESNYVSAICDVIVIVLMCIAISESRWFYVRGGGCSNANQTTVSYLGIKTFLYQGSSSSFVNPNAYYYGNSLHDGKCLFSSYCLRIYSIARLKTCTGNL